MNQNSRNDEMNNEQNDHELRKITYWKKYGVKCFPYRGKRRYTPCVYQSEDGGIIISNDVFGLTIRQFDRSYKACLDRRKTQEQYILNIRYPDKTSDEYMEYLENNIYCNKDNLSWSGNDLKERYLYEHLVRTAGTEIDIRKRQQLFIIIDMIHNLATQELTRISSGSLAEGIDLPGSDIDIMFVFRDVDVIQDERHVIHPVKRNTLVIETDNDHPGFTRLRLLPKGDVKINCKAYEYFDETRKGLYLSSTKFVCDMSMMFPGMIMSPHGPCSSDKDRDLDLAFCVRSKYLPYNTISWASRYRQQWPPNSTIDKIKKYGCLLVPIGPSYMSDSSLLWRFSFSVAEKQLVHTFNFTQLLCYCLLKLTLKHIVNTNKYDEALLCSYFLKTTLFWVSEEIDLNTFQLSKLYFCFSLCLDKLKLWVKKCYCPNYFIPEHNMFLGKVNSDNNTILLNILDDITSDGIDGLTQYLFPNDRLLTTDSESSFTELDFFFYRIGYVDDISNMKQCLKTRMFIESLIKSKYSTFIIDVCKHYHAHISQHAAQLLPPPTITTETYNIQNCYHRFLQDGTKTDAVSGWLLYASFYYVTGQFDVTLRLIDYVLSRCSPDMIIFCHGSYEDRVKNNYRNHVHSTMTLNEKIRIATVSDIHYEHRSPLIPNELQLEVNDTDMFFSPTVMSHCLRFLCYHHLGDIFNRQKALWDLYSTVNNKYFIRNHGLSVSMTILGVCFEISGDKNAAYQCYDEVRKCDGFIIPSAKLRKKKLLRDLI